VLTHDELHLAAGAVLHLEVGEEDVEQVVAHPVDHELARVGQGELVVDEADWFDRLEVGLEGVAAQATLQPIDGSSPQIEGGALGFH